ncbi:MAK10-like protein [Tanacetum coccineum]
MGDVNPICTLRDYSKPSTRAIGIPLSSPLRSEDPNQHLKDFLKLVDSLDLDGENRGRTRMRLFQFSLRDQASNWIERLPARSITTWDDLTTRFLAQFFPPGRTAKLRNDALLEDLALYDNKSWNNPRDFAKPIKAISLPQDVLSTSDCRLIELENQVQRLMEAHLAPMQPTQVNKITSSCEICNGPHDTQYYMENLEQTFVDYASSRTDETRKQNRNPSSPKRVHFVNSIVILNKEDEAKEEGNVKTNTTEYKDHEMTVESEEKFEEETKEEIKEDKEDSPKHFDTFPTMKELRCHEWLLKNPLKHFDTFPTMKELRLHYNWIMSKRLGQRRKPSNPRKIYNFIGRVKGLKFFVGNFTYEYDFMVLEDTTSVIDHDLGSVVFGKPFVEATGLIYDMEEGTIMFEKDKEKIVLYLIRRSLEVLRKFHWMTLGGRFNQLSHVSSPLLSKPGEY